MAEFAYAYEHKNQPLCYNGDVFTKEAYLNILEKFPKICGVMMGRGVLRDPGLVGKILGEPEPSRDIWKDFLERLHDEFCRVSVNEEKALFKLKEIWCYLRYSFGDTDIWDKRIKRAQSLREYEEAIKQLFE